MKILVINLEHAKEKKYKMETILSSISSNYEFFNGINGKQLKSNEYSVNLDWYNPCDNTHMTLGEIGCALSHYNIWKKIIDENIETAIILEDDIEIVDPDFLNICKNIDPQLYDLIYLSRKKMLDISETSATNINNNLVEPCFSYWTSAYILSLSGAKKLCLNLYLNNLIPVDEYMGYIAGKSQHHNIDSQNILDKYYGSIKKNLFKSFAFEPQLIKPDSSAFSNSSTFHSTRCSQFRDDIMCITVGTDNNDCCKRYVESCKKYGIEPIILGMGEQWLGGNMIDGPGGGHKINLLKKYLESISDNKILIFTDCYDVIMNNNINIIIEKYKKLFHGKIVFAGETSCWPDKNLIASYPEHTKNIPTRYLNSGLFIGYTNDIKNVLSENILDNSDDQLYYTNLFLKQDNITIDYNCELFLCLNGITDRINIDKSMNCLIYNNNRPTFIHGNGPENIKLFFNNIITNYCTSYNSIYGYYYTNKISNNKLLFVLKEEDKYTNINDWLNGIKNLDYNKKDISIIFVHNTDFAITRFQNIISRDEYNYIKIVRTFSYNIWFDVFNNIDNIEFDYLLFCKSNSIITNPDTINILLSQNKDIIAPLLIKKGLLFSNFWGDVDNTGYYSQSSNYLDIINYNERGCWNVPYISDTILIHKDYINMYNFTNIKNNIDDPDLIFCYNIRDNYNFMYILNTENYGYYDAENSVNTTPETINLNTINTNKKLWESKYLNPLFINDDIYTVHKDLGNDIHFLQLFTPIFCKEIIEVSENNGSWSKGGNSYYDNRINNIENHPTRDIQLYDINLEEMWKKIIDYYIARFMWKHYRFSTKGQNISFVVKYSLDGQRELNPHHDSSAYTVNMCLNSDFSGGGCRFIKQNKVIINKEIGSLVIHPGRITHYHEGLPISDGIRYILISFID